MARSFDPKKLSLWRGRFRRFLDSGLTVARFCAMEHVSESSFYYWQKKLRPQVLRRPARAEGRDACSEERDAYSEEYSVFRPVTVVPANCGVVVRLPGGIRIEMDAGHLDAIRAVVAEAVRIDQDQTADRNASSGKHVIRKASSGNQVIRKASFNNHVIRTRGGIASC